MTKGLPTEPHVDLNDEILTREEAVAFLKTSPTQFAKWPIAVVHLDGRPRFLKSTLLKFAKEREQAA